MERAVGEVFDFKGEMLQVKDIGKEISCDECYFAESGHNCWDASNSDYMGYCNGTFRSDGKNVVFVEVKGSGCGLESKYMDFSRVLQYLKDGAVARRESWSGNKSIFLAKDIVGVLPFFCINTKDGHKGVYTATACDLLAEDWMVIKI